MFRSGMVEEKEGKIRVPPGVSLQAYRGLLEFVYLGEGHCKGGPCHVCFARDDGLLCLCLWVYIVMHALVRWFGRHFSEASFHDL